MGILLGVSQGEVWGWTSLTTVVLTASGVAAVAAWVPWTMRSDHPLVDLRLAVQPTAIGAHLTALLAGAGMYMGLTLVMVVVQAHTAADWGLGRSVVVAGLMLVPYSLLSVGGSRVALAAGRWISPHRLLPIGCTIYFASNVLLAFAHDHVWQLLIVMSLAGLGSGCTFAMIPLLLIRAVPPAETSSALGFQQVLRYIGFSIGSTLGVTILRLASEGPEPDGAGLAVAALSTAGVCGLAGLVAWRSTGRAHDAAVTQTEDDSEGHGQP